MDIQTTPRPVAGPALSPPGDTRHRILVDLSHAADGYVGIAQDTRLIFDMLATLPGVDVAGLLMPTARHDLPRVGGTAADEMALSAGVLHWMARNWASREYPRLLGRFGRLMELRSILRTDHKLLRVRLAERSSAIWRVLFEKTLPPERRAAILQRPFYATDLSVMRIIDRTMALPGLSPKRLDATGFDFVFFCMPRPVRLPRGTRQIVRFHDAVPVTDTDTIASWKTGVAHQRLVRLCEPDAVFVCNSPPSVEDLAALDPRRAERAHVIPCALAPPPPAVSIPFAAIVEARRSFRALGDSRAHATRPPVETAPRYILAVSTLEPRKNFTGLIRGWERVVNRSAPDLRLVIVGNAGWREEPVLRAMAPHVRAGRIIHLQGLPQDELAAIARGAACFALPSFNEGFGYPPLEALQAGTPVIVSDLPVFRWIFGDGALYVEPYDAESIADAIERLAAAPDADMRRAELLSRRSAVINRFTTATIREQWAALLDSLQPPSR